jgi:hypothetical protein
VSKHFRASLSRLGIGWSKAARLLGVSVEQIEAWRRDDVPVPDGTVPRLVMLKICALPDWHPDWDREKKSPNLDVHRTDQAQSEPSKTRVSQGLEDRAARDQPSGGTRGALI